MSMVPRRRPERTDRRGHPRMARPD